MAFHSVGRRALHVGGEFRRPVSLGDSELGRTQRSGLVLRVHGEKGNQGMRVLWVFSYLSKQLELVAANLAARRGITLEIMCPVIGDHPDVPASIPTTPLTCRNKLDFKSRRQIREKVRNGNFDIVHAYTSRNLANVLAACRGLRPMPKVVGYRGTMNRLRLLDPANWITFWHPGISNIICVCDATNRALQESGIDPAKLTTVWEGCDPKNIPALPRSARAQFNIPDDAFVVGMVANMRPVKGIDLLLRAAIETADLSKLYLLLIGRDEDPRIAKLAADRRIADRVRLAGPLSVGGQYASLMDVYAAPSRMEGLSMSIMEAMIQGACPLVSNVGGIPELVRDQADGIVVPSEDVSALAAGMRLLHDEPQRRKAMAESARQRILNTFSIDRWSHRLVDSYESALGESGRNHGSVSRAMVSTPATATEPRAA
ncbi:MAG: glycosyltransferase family 4 protein [Pirellulaceae bacterium]|nr:glycosyltransferase family 4 protein [Pirellulaceae bacterium]